MTAFGSIRLEGGSAKIWGETLALRAMKIEERGKIEDLVLPIESHSRLATGLNTALAQEI